MAHVPDDLMDYDLPMKVIKQILWVREQKRKAQGVITPSEARVALAKKRIDWCDKAETALKNGKQPETDFPSGKKAKEEEKTEAKAK